MQSNNAQLPSSTTADDIESTQYSKSMFRLHSICLSFLSTAEQERIQQGKVTFQLGRIDEMLANAAPHLQSDQSCTSLQQRLERIALKMHSSFLRAELCRPFLAQATMDNESTMLRKSCVQSIQDTVQAYLDMSKISILPLRSWSFTHEALSCGCVLALLQPTRSDSHSKNILDKLQRLLQEVFQSDGSDGMNGTFYRGMKLLEFLREHTSSIKEATQQRNVVQPERDATTVAPHQDPSERDKIDHDGTSSLFGAPANFLAPDLSQTWIEPLFTEGGFDSSLSSFLDLSSDLFH